MQVDSEAEQWWNKVYFNGIFQLSGRETVMMSGWPGRLHRIPPWAMDG